MRPTLLTGHTANGATQVDSSVETDKVSAVLSRDKRSVGSGSGRMFVIKLLTCLQLGVLFRF